MNEINIKARAKINLTLEITGKRNDGYHSIETIMQTVHFHDEIKIRRTKNKGVSLETNLHFLPTDARNLVVKVAGILLKKYHVSGGLSIILQKNIPVSAGLGGGSSDCAATIIGLNQFLNLQMPLGEMKDLAGSLGADIPFLLEGGCQLATGFGEQLKTLPAFPFAFVLLIKPPKIISTQKIFKQLKPTDIREYTTTNAFVSAYQRGLSHLPKKPINSLEKITATAYPLILDLKNDLLDKGAILSQMTGSGPTVFGLFRDKQTCFKAMNALRKKYAFIRIWKMTGIDPLREIPFTIK